MAQVLQNINHFIQLFNFTFPDAKIEAKLYDEGCIPVPKVKLWATWKLAESPLAKSAFPPSNNILVKDTSVKN